MLKQLLLCRRYFGLLYLSPNSHSEWVLNLSRSVHLLWSLTERSSSRAVHNNTSDCLLLFALLSCVEKTCSQHLGRAIVTLRLIGSELHQPLDWHPSTFDVSEFSHKTSVDGPRPQSPCPWTPWALHNEGQLPWGLIGPEQVTSKGLSRAHQPDLTPC